MDRRDFLGTMIGGVAAVAAVRSFPFRVYSFPSNIVVTRNLMFDEVWLFRALTNAAKIKRLRHFDLGITSPWESDRDVRINRAVNKLIMAAAKADRP